MTIPENRLRYLEDMPMEDLNAGAIQDLIDEVRRLRGENEWLREAYRPIETANLEIAVLQEQVERLRKALNDIVNASRDEGLAVMCNWMRNRAAAALTLKDNSAP